MDKVPTVWQLVIAVIVPVVAVERWFSPLLNFSKIARFYAISFVNYPECELDIGKLVVIYIG